MDLLEEEKNLIENYQSCSIDKISEIVDNVSEINLEELNYELRKSFYNVELMRAMSCITDSIFEIEGVKKFIKSFKSKKFISTIKKINDDSFEVTKNIVDIFVLKIPNNLENKDKLVHECFIGLFGTNSLRELIPNFAYVYNGLRCKLPKVSNEMVQNLSLEKDKNKEVQCIVYENIYPNITFVELCQNYSFEDFMSYFFQLIYSLVTAYEECEFTHGNLLCENVLIRGVKKEQFYIRYNTEGQNIFIKSTGAITTIINYGSAHIKYNKISYGFKGSVLKDIKTFLKDLWQKTKNIPEMSRLENLLGFFKQKHTEKNMYNFLTTCYEIIDCSQIILAEQPENVFECYQECLPMDVVFENLDILKTPNSFSRFLNMYKEKSIFSSKGKFLEEFDFITIYEKESLELIEKYKKTSYLNNAVKNIYSVENYSHGDYVNNYELFKKYVEDINLFIYDYKILIKSTNIFTDVLKLYKIRIPKKMENITEKTKLFSKRVDKILMSVKKDYEYLINKDSSLQRFLKNNGTSIFELYFQKYPNIYFSNI